MEMLKVKIIPDPESFSQHSQLPIFNHSQILMCYNAYKLDYQVGHLSFCPCGPLHMFVRDH